MKRIILSIVAIIMGAFIAFAPFSNPVFADPPQSGKSINDLLIEAKKAKEQCKNSSNCTTYDKIVQQLSQKDSNTLKNTKTAYEKQRKEDIEKCKNDAHSVACTRKDTYKLYIDTLSKAVNKNSSSNAFKTAATSLVSGVASAVNKATGGNSSSSSSSGSSSGSVSVPATSDSSAVGSTTDADTPEAAPEISSEAAYSGSENEGCVKTAIIGGGEVCDDGNGSSIYQILNLIVDIMTIGVGILGVVGISVAGIMYLTAGDKEDQTKKAKRRLLEIVIGLVLYVVAYALLKWLLPGFNGTGGV